MPPPVRHLIRREWDLDPDVLIVSHRSFAATRLTMRDA